MKKIVFLLAVAVSACQSKQPKVAENIEKSTLTIAFGSCATQEKINPMWPSIAANKPDVFIWLGDNIYGDTYDMAEMADKYARQKSQPLYQDFLKTGTTIIGTWDDHDFGWDDAGKEYPHKEESKNLMLDFLGVDERDEVRNRPGVYQSYTFGNDGQRVKVILLDTRWFRDAIQKDTTGAGRFMAQKNGEILGEEQWAWLEKELTNSDAQVHIIGSSIQLISNQHGWEKWGNFTDEQDRFYHLIARLKPANTIVLSGDRHLAELSRIKPVGADFWLYDITSSGMTHIFIRPQEEENPYRIGPFMQHRNWGLLKIDFEKSDVNITAEIRGEADSLFYSHIVEK